MKSNAAQRFRSLEEFKKNSQVGQNIDQNKNKTNCMNKHTPIHLCTKHARKNFLSKKICSQMNISKQNNHLKEITRIQSLTLEYAASIKTNHIPDLTCN